MSIRMFTLCLSVTIIAIFSGCSIQAAPIYDDFSGTSIQEGLWSQRVTGQDSRLEIKDGVLIATAMNDPNGETGRSGLNFVNPEFEAFQADFKIVEFKGKEKTRARLEGYAYNTDTRVSESRQGEIALYFHIRATGQVGYAIEKCDDTACEARTTIARDTIATVNPGDQQTLSMGFKQPEAYFRLDNGRIITVNVTEKHPVGTSGWGYASVRARSKESSESVTVEIDNVRVGTVKELFGR